MTSCEDMGFTRGTQAYAQCVQADLDRRERRAASMRAAGAALAAPSYPAPQAPRQTQCFDRGGRIDCTTY